MIRSPGSASVFSYTLATLPLSTTLTPGTVVRVTNLGGTGGSFLEATTAGWVPLNGSAVLASQWGTLASPLSTVTGVTSGLFTPAGGVGSLVIPAGLLIASRSKLEIEWFAQKVGANATCALRTYLGALGTASDPAILNLSLVITDGISARPAISVGFIEGNMVTTQGIGPGGQSATVGLLDKTIDLTVANTISFGFAAGHASDSYRLIGYSVKLITI